MVRLWLKKSERHPSPAPAETDARVPFIIGITLWLGALIAAPVLVSHFDTGRWPSTAVAGIALGLVGILYELRHRSRR